MFTGLFIEIFCRLVQLLAQFFETGTGIPIESVRRRIVFRKLIELKHLAELAAKDFEQLLLLRIFLSPDQGCDPDQPIVKFCA